MWIKRDISDKIVESRRAVQIIRGPRQCGKTSLILKLDPSFIEVSLDDPQLRELANRDPEVFLSQFRGRKLFIDEVQYAPNLFPSIKRQVDLWKRTNQSQQTLYRLTGSNQILLDKNVKESLAGRVSYFDMNTLSIHEIRKHLDVPIQTILYQGGWPELYATEGINAKDYLDDYINTYVEKDIVLSAGIQKRAEFLKFLRLLAGRVGQLVDYASLGRESGVEAKTAKEWLSVLEQMNLVCVTQPYSTNMSSRLVKAPKVYFIDTGLAARLQGWSSPGPILTSPQQGGLFENLVCSEIYKAINNFRLDWRIYHWRSRDNEEIDFLIEKDPSTFLFVEAKVSVQRTPNISKYREVRRVFGESIPEVIICHQEGDRILEKNVPVALLVDRLLA